MVRSQKRVRQHVHHVPHPKCRPGKTAHGTKALQLRSNGRWGKDNGEPGLAFIGIAAGETSATSGTVWIANCACKEYGQCPLARALAVAPEHDFYAVSVVRRRVARGSKLKRSVSRVHSRIW